MIDLLLRPDTPVFGRDALSSGLSGVADVVTQAALPIWALSLALLGLAMLTRSAAALGYGLGESAQELIRWFFVCLLSGNALPLVDLLHGAMTILASAIVTGGMGNASERLWQGLFPQAMFDPEFPLTLLIIGMLLAMILVAVMAVSFVARYVLLLILAALAPLAIATEGIPFTRFVCREWLGAFVKVELLHVMNAVVLVVFGRMLTLLTGSGGLVAVILSFVVMVGIVSVISTLNFKVFQYVFGAAIDAASQSVRLAAGLIAFAASGGLSGGMSLATASGLAGVVGGATGDPLSRGLADGLRLGGQTTAQNEMTAHARRLNSGERAGDASGDRIGSGGAQTTSDASAPAYRTPQLQLGAAREASRAAESRRRASDLQAAGTGARAGDERESVRSAFTDLSAIYGPEHVGRAAQAVAPALKAMARQNRDGLSGAAAALGYSSAGDLAGAFAEENLLGAQGVAAKPGGTLFGAAPARALLEHSLGFSNAASAPPTAVAGATTGAPAGASIGESTSALAQSDATTLSARRPEETRQVGAAVAALSAQHGAGATRDALRTVAPTLTALANRAGGLGALAQAAGFSDSGAMTQAVVAGALAPQSTADSSPVPQGVARAGADGAPSSTGPSNGAIPAASIVTGGDAAQPLQAPVFDSAAGQPLSSAAQALGYASPAALSAALGQATTLPAMGAQPTTQAASPTAPPMGDTTSTNGSAGSHVAAAQSAPPASVHLPAATAAGLPMAQAILASPLASPAQQAQALGASSQRETESVAAAISALGASHGAEAARAALGHIAPAMHTASAHVGMTPAARALGYADAGAWVSAWAGTSASSAAGAKAQPTSQPAAPASTAQSAPTMPLALPASPEETRAMDGAINTLRAAYGGPAVETALGSVMPVMRALGSAQPGDAPLSALAQQLGFGDAGRMTGALLEGHILGQQGLPATHNGQATGEPARTPMAGPLYGGIPMSGGAQASAALSTQTGDLPMPAVQPDSASAAVAGPAATPVGAPTAAPVEAPSAALLANALTHNTPPGQAQAFDQVAGMSMAQQLRLPPNFGPVLSNLVWSLRAENPDTGPLWQVYRASESLGRAHDDPKQAYEAFRNYVDELYAQPGVEAFHRPWQPGTHPLPNRRSS